MSSKGQPQQQKTKELKVFMTQVVTPENVKKDPKKMILLNIVKALGSASEKSIVYLLYLIQKERGINLGYKFLVVGNSPVSREVIEDLKALQYVGFIESDPQTRKIRLTSNGQEFLEKNPINIPYINEVLNSIEEFRQKVMAIEAEIELKQSSVRTRGR